ncbi:MAG TPA: leucyl aminopeptidase family protein [Bacteroidales bacterium]|nr:leucyl aminopeptidase family protein [Bacteroidales bacterium]HRZ47927.1 leucyl aminopeptidase family protein [Bacteroidales bacterium]
MESLFLQSQQIPAGSGFALLLPDGMKPSTSLLKRSEKQYLEDFRTHYPERRVIILETPDRMVVALLLKQEENFSETLESCRRLGSDLADIIDTRRIATFSVTALLSDFRCLAALAEGVMLAGYRYLNWFSVEKRKEKQFPLRQLILVHKKYDKELMQHTEVAIRSIFLVRDLVNEPPANKSAEVLAQRLAEMATPSGILCDVMHRKHIEALKMGGLLAVNRGSIDHPAFAVMEWKPADAVNTKPIVLVGKGVTFDTGGMNLKTGTFMDGMKSDMAGAATMAAVLMATATLKLPLYIIALMPFTDNRVDGNAFLPGDVITMHDGTTVEIKNTDAEGRLILADALSYARRFDPMLLITAATLTGSAMRAIGAHGTVAMHHQAARQMELLKKTGEDLYERIVEFPMWKEYADELRSDIADLANLGGPNGGAIIAGKFLQHFVQYPFIHLDIAGTAFLEKRAHYIPAGGTGTGVRLLLHFLLNFRKTLT